MRKARIISTEACEYTIGRLMEVVDIYTYEDALDISKDIVTQDTACEDDRKVVGYVKGRCNDFVFVLEDEVELLDKEETIKIKYHSQEIDKLKYIDGKSDWIDLRSAENVSLKQGDFKLISLGVSMELPKGYEATVVPRSSTYKNFGVLQTNSIGIIDETYCGDNDIWKFPALAMRDTEIHIGDRICQFRIQKHQPTIVFKEVDKLTGNERGGFGSTGVK